MFFLHILTGPDEHFRVFGLYVYIEVMRLKRRSGYWLFWNCVTIIIEISVITPKNLT